MTEHTIVEGRRLGKVLDPPQDPRTLRLSTYLDATTLKPAPRTVRWSPFVPAWPMYLNDQLGDCEFAAMAHADQLWNLAGQHTTTAPQLTDAQVEAAYSAVTGYVPGDPSTDRGTILLDALRWWRSTGLAGGRRIYAFAEVEVANHELVRDGVYYLGGLNVGVALPVAAQRMGQHWTRPSNLRGANAPGSWGGHAIWAVDVDRYGVTVVSWGELIRVSWAFWDAYVDEVFGVISPELIEASGVDTHGFNLGQLQADLGGIGTVTT